MSRHEPKAKIIVDQTKYPNASPLNWNEIVELLKVPRGTSWLSTVSAEGKVHTTPIGAFFVNGTYYFTSGQGTRKRANLAQNPSATICTHAGDYDIVVEGTAAITHDEAKIQQFAAYCRSVDWPVEAQGTAIDAPYHAPTTGPAPYDVYEMTIQKAFINGTSDEAVNHGTFFTF